MFKGIFSKKDYDEEVVERCDVCGAKGPTSESTISGQHLCYYCEMDEIDEELFWMSQF